VERVVVERIAGCFVLQDYEQEGDFGLVAWEKE
jgi:hypothetical protein